LNPNAVLRKLDICPAVISFNYFDPEEKEDYERGIQLYAIATELFCSPERKEFLTNEWGEQIDAKYGILEE
jgi:hypothetical protein